MGDFRSFHLNKRVPAKAMEPVVDPANWDPNELRDVDSWSYRITDRDVSELAAGVAAVKKAGVDIVDVDRDNFPHGPFAKILGDVREELAHGRGIVMIKDFPVDQFDREAQAIAYLGLGSYLGKKLIQNAQGHILGHVKDLGGDYWAPNTRSYVTNAELRFHTDTAEYVGLLCLERPMQGGQSRIASSVTIYNRLLQRRPDIVKLLLEEWYYTKSGEINPGEDPWHKQPVFGFEQGYFGAGSINAHTEKAQKLPGVPQWDAAHLEAVKVYYETVEECAIDITFEKGDIQFLNNHVMLHSRREYKDWPAEDGRKRHLLRLWLSDPVARPVVKARREGRSGKGVVLDGMKVIAPLDVHEMA